MPDRVPASNHNPHNLPTKTCPVCKREFTWRKKWERDWENVRYCSEQCRRQSTVPATSSQRASEPDSPE